ncbi:hypothetical protein Tco_0044690 [Tanacetum coccineum]
MTKQGNYTQRTPQAKKQSDQASRQVSKQSSGKHQYAIRTCLPSYGMTYPGGQPKSNRTIVQSLKGRGGVWLGSRDIHSRLGQRRSPSESPPSSDSEDSRRKRRRRVSSSSEDTSDNEDAETGHWKSKNKYREDEDEDMSRPWRRQKVDAFTRRISDFSEDKKRRMPANVKTYDGTGDPDDHLKIFESAATIENWPQPVWCHMFNSTLVGNARNWFSKLPRQKQ